MKCSSCNGTGHVDQIHIGRVRNGIEEMDPKSYNFNVVPVGIAQIFRMFAKVTKIRLYHEHDGDDLQATIYYRES